MRYNHDERDRVSRNITLVMSGTGIDRAQVILTPIRSMRMIYDVDPRVCVIAQVPAAICARAYSQPNEIYFRRTPSRNSGERKAAAAPA